MMFTLVDLERNVDKLFILAVAKSLSNTPITVFLCSLHLFECSQSEFLLCSGQSLNNITQLSSLDSYNRIGENLFCSLCSKELY